MSVPMADRDLASRSIVHAYVAFYFAALPFIFLAVWLFGNVGLAYTADTLSAVLQDGIGTNWVEELTRTPRPSQ